VWDRHLRCWDGEVHKTDNRCRPRCSSQCLTSRKSDTTKLCLRTHTLQYHRHHHHHHHHRHHHHHHHHHHNHHHRYHFYFLCLRQARLAGVVGIISNPIQYSNINIPIFNSTRRFVRLLPNLWTWYFENKWSDFDANLHNWSTGRVHKMTNFGGQEVKG